MENPELTQKNTPETIQPLNPLVEKPIEEETSALLLEMDQKIEQKKQVIEETKNNINEIRASLNMPPTDEIPPSIQTEQEVITKLSQERAAIEQRIQEIVNRATLKVEGIPTLTDSKDIQEYKKLQKQLEDSRDVETGQESKEPNKESENENMKRFEGNLRKALDDISSRSKTMLDALYERQQKRLTPLQNSDEFHGMVSHLKNIKNFEGVFDIENLDRINKNIQKISRLIDDIKIRQSSGQIREDLQNLEKLAYGAKSFSASTNEAARNLGPELADQQMEEKRKELRKNLSMLSEQAQRLNFLATSLRSNFR